MGKKSLSFSFTLADVFLYPGHLFKETSGLVVSREHWKVLGYIIISIALLLF